MSNMGAQLSFDNPAFRIYAINATILIVKMLLMSPLTSMYRLSKGIFANPEDLYFVAAKKNPKVKFDDADVERIRRAHQNDLENIPAFLLISWLYLVSGPPLAWARLLLGAYSACRVGHTLVYAVRPTPQPARATFFFGGLFITLYMAAHVAVKAVF